MNINNIDNKLLIWYSKYSDSSLPWRLDPNPYKTWISEIMLQQTQVNTVIPYFDKWMKQYPTINKLSQSSIDDLLILWQGLGYYKRVENILASSKIIQDKYNNILPDKYEDLITLKGIGDYTASAILTIAFKKKYLPIDGNIKRILSRLYMLSKKHQNISHYKTLLSIYINDKNPGDCVQALMDIGRTICMPKKPKCIRCPLLIICKAYKYNKIEKYPIKTKKNIPNFSIVVGYIVKNKKFIITKRQKNKLLANLWELPGGKIQTNETSQNALKREVLEELDIKIKNLNFIGEIKHQYSHFKLNITLFKCEYLTGNPKPLQSQAYKWITKKKIKDFAFPAATHKLFKLIH
tara:strand:- start:1174 stop:2223 length:1050 start_codon:yes stop_codon:yes gene_type:complete